MASNYQKLYYSDYEKAVAERDAAKTELARQAREISFLRGELKKAEQRTAALEALVKNLIAQNKELVAQNKELAAQNKELAAQNKDLREEVDRLKSILDNDSHNSSLPPSQDKPRKANEYNARKKSEKKSGAQKGHAGKTVSEEDVKKILASPDCKHIIQNHGKPGRHYTSRYVLDMQVVPVVTEHRYYDSVRPNGNFISYGDTVKSVIVSLYGAGVMALNRIVSFIHELTHHTLRIAEGTVYQACQTFANRAASEIDRFEQHLMNRKNLHTDATYITVNGEQNYIRNISDNQVVVYYPMASKTIRELERIDLLKKYKGTLVHDHETALYHFGLEHAECNVHVCRYLRKNAEDTGNQWSCDMENLLEEMRVTREEALKNGVTSFSEDVIASFEKRYDDILCVALIQNESTHPKWAKKDEKTLINRMQNYKQQHLLFLHDFSVAYSNNLSERDLRKCKNRQKMAGGFRTFEGCKMYCLIMSVIETAKRNGKEVFNVLRCIFQGEETHLVTI